MSGRCLGTYDPFTVIKLGVVGQFRNSILLSRAYNVSHGYVWAGPESREDIRVDFCAKPARLVPIRADG
jgi:hypothetical protein